MNGLSKTKLTLYLAAIFLAGGVSGAMLALRVSRQTMAEAPRPGRLDARYLKERFQSRLALTPEQAKVIEPILEKMSEELKSVRQDATKRISAIMKSFYDQIGKELTPDQRQKLDEMQKDHHPEHREGPHKRFKPSPDSFRRSNSPPQDP
jgi:Spy/CpxP family protein refolding chaperone